MKMFGLSAKEQIAERCARDTYTLLRNDVVRSGLTAKELSKFCLILIRTRRIEWLSRALRMVPTLPQKHRNKMFDVIIEECDSVAAGQCIHDIERLSLVVLRKLVSVIQKAHDSNAADHAIQGAARSQMPEDVLNDLVKVIIASRDTTLARRTYRYRKNKNIAPDLRRRLRVIAKRDPCWETSRRR